MYTLFHCEKTDRLKSFIKKLTFHWKNDTIHTDVLQLCGRNTFICNITSNDVQPVAGTLLKGVKSVLHNRISVGIRNATNESFGKQLVCSSPATKLFIYLEFSMQTFLTVIFVKYVTYL